MAALLAVSWCVGAACAQPDKPAPVQEQTLDVELEVVDATVIFGGQMLFEVRGAEAIVPAETRVFFSGRVGAQDVEASFSAPFEETPDGLSLSITWDRLETILGITGEVDFVGNLRLEVADLGGGLTGVDELTGVTIAFRQTLSPSIEFPPFVEIFANSLSTYPADGILRQGEGSTELVFDLTFVPDDGGAQELIQATIPVSVGESRQQAQVNWSVAAMGIRPGVFDGTVQQRNNHAQGPVVDGPLVGLTVTLLPTEIDGFDPPAASRGQIMRALGRGFIPSDAQLGQSMFFVLDGMFETLGGTTLDFSGPEAVQVAPESITSHNEAQIVLRSQLEDRNGRQTLTGLTAAPGTFQGTITPVLVNGVTTVSGRPFRGSLSIAPTHQAVYIRFLPGFSEALDTFGLRNVEPEIRARILEVVRRDYAGFNISFDDIRPPDFVEYSIIEVGGEDPNGAGLFGLDNSAGKDTGNVRLNDIIGSENAESGELGFYVFGGVFIESFRTFSPTLDGDSPVASSRFDDIFSPFTPSLGGTVVDASEWPSGPRAEKIEQAIRAFGSVIGNTITHEIGHSLGMSFYQMDLFAETNQFHNNFDEPGAIMDAGQNRTFEERAEIDGAPTPYFNDRNTEYLQRYLPMP